MVDADASQEGIGAVLSHQHNGRVLTYASRVLTKTERQYCATRREMLALVWSVYVSLGHTSGGVSLLSVQITMPCVGYVT